MTFYPADDGGVGFNLPFTSETMPTGAEWLADNQEVARRMMLARWMSR